MTLRERMEAMGWLLEVDPDTLEAFWSKSEPVGRKGLVTVATFPGDRDVWENDLRACGAGDEAFGRG